MEGDEEVRRRRRRGRHFGGEERGKDAYITRREGSEKGREMYL